MSQGISREDGAIEIIKPSQKQLVQLAIHKNSLSVAGPDRTPGVALVNFENDRDNFDSYQECGDIPDHEPKREPKVEVTTDTYLDCASDNELVE